MQEGRGLCVLDRQLTEPKTWVFVFDCESIQSANLCLYHTPDFSALVWSWRPVTAIMRLLHQHIGPLALCSFTYSGQLPEILAI